MNTECHCSRHAVIHSGMWRHIHCYTQNSSNLKINGSEGFSVIPYRIYIYIWLMHQHVLKPLYVCWHKSMDCSEFLFYVQSQWIKPGRKNRAHFSTYLPQQSKQHVCAQGTLMSLIHNNGTVVVQIWLSKGLPQKNTISHVFYHCFLFTKIYQGSCDRASLT